MKQNKKYILLFLNFNIWAKFTETTQHNVAPNI